MTISRARIFAYSLLLGLALGGALGFCQNDQAEKSLGDVVRQQRTNRQQSKTARRVISDDDITPPHSHWLRSQVAFTRIIPSIHVSALVPDGVSADPDQKQKMYIGFGPEYWDGQYCDADLDCAAKTFMARLNRSPMTSGARVLFDEDTSIGGYAARVAHFELRHEVRGKMQGSVALVRVPVTVVAAYCMYRPEDKPEVEPQCDAFISSLRIAVPEKYIYVEHHNYY